MKGLVAQLSRGFMGQQASKTAASVSAARLKKVPSPKLTRNFTEERIEVPGLTKGPWPAPCCFGGGPRPPALRPALLSGCFYGGVLLWVSSQGTGPDHLEFILGSVSAFRPGL